MTIMYDLKNWPQNPSRYFVGQKQVEADKSRVIGCIEEILIHDNIARIVTKHFYENEVDCIGTNRILEYPSIQIIMVTIFNVIENLFVALLAIQYLHNPFGDAITNVV